MNEQRLQVASAPLRLNRFITQPLMAIHGEFCARDIVYFAYILKEILACLVSYLYAKYTISRAQNPP